MGHRYRDSRPRLALWMLVAFGDVVLLLVSVGLSVLAALVSVLAVTVAGVAGWWLARRAAAVGGPALPVPAGQSAPSAVGRRPSPRRA
ncbi:hypothetical protein GA0070616_3514 [Micromonospora nigra]|uniref:Uncharacterized protein n=1 Tax=Micromonospora nigra TaxID=145857 RepID=A0A1C6SDD9_9ACTN|nr:hypothetical protein [Micromonospora nigra]SCL27514.1 hypothetical protein GA0070616_3514 [Micromonospora nigra]